MQCESCGEAEATVHLTQIVEGEVRKLHLCKDCARDSGINVDEPLSITDLLLNAGSPSPLETTEADKSCPRCHMRGSDFKKTSRLGCPYCYEAFAAGLAPILLSMHRSQQHVGKAPRQYRGVAVEPGLKVLETQLKEAIATEQFEEAAQLRDRIAARQAGGGRTEPERSA